MTETLTVSQVQKLFPKRNENSHKGDFGYITLIGGCVKYSGAIRLAALANSAMRCGAGVCTIAAPKSLTDVILPQILESTFYPISDNDGDMLFKASEFDELISRSDVIAFGMGIGNTRETRRAISYLLKKFEGILIVDADGLNAMAKLSKAEITGHKCKLILTPHPKEFSRLAKIDVKELTKDCCASASKLAKELNAIVLLKGHVSTVSDGEKCLRVEKGCAGMATAGSGDVLSGIVSAIAASNKDNLLYAVASAAYVNGLAGEIASEENGEVSMLASDTAACVHKAVNQIIKAAPKLSEESAEQKTVSANNDKKSVKKVLFTMLMIALLAVSGWYTLECVKEEKLEAERLYAAMDHREQQDEYDMVIPFCAKDIYIDGILVNNYQLSRPFGVYKNSVYVPLTEEICDALGIKAEWNADNITDIYITETKANHAGAFFGRYGWNPYDIKGFAEGNVTVYIFSGDEERKVYPNEDQTVSYNNGEVMYIPLSMLSKCEILDITAYYDLETGLYISTDADIPAKSYYSENNSKYIAGRVAYISSHQPDLGLDVCRYYEYIFRHEATEMDVDEDLLLAIARTESSFNVNDLSSAGARGIMQIMPDTAKNQGINPDSLYDLHVSVQFGAAYIRDAIKNFKGDMIKALSVYNFGGNAVLGGAYDTGYANTVLSRMETMKQWYLDNGYSNEFYTVLECTK